MNAAAAASFRSAGALPDEDDDHTDLPYDIDSEAGARAVAAWLAATVPCPAGCDDGLIRHDNCRVCKGWGRVPKTTQEAP